MAGQRPRRHRRLHRFLTGYLVLVRKPAPSRRGNRRTGRHLGSSATEQALRSALQGSGLLEVHELLDLSIRAPVIFLSGCETGVGGAYSTATPSSVPQPEG